MLVTSSVFVTKDVSTVVMYSVVSYVERETLDVFFGQAVCHPCRQH